MRRIAAIAALVLVACADPQETDDGPFVDYAPSGPMLAPEPMHWLTVHVAPDVDPIATLDAAAAWQRALATSCPIDIRVAIGPNETLTNAQAVYVAPGEPPKGYDGWTENQVITIRSGLTPRRKASVARHELGHALGLNHAPSGLMAPDSGSSGIDPDAAQAVAKLWCNR